MTVDKKSNNTYEKDLLILPCKYCKKDIGYMAFNSRDEMVDTTRTLNDLGAWTICVECTKKHSTGVIEQDMNLRLGSYKK